ncbi:DMT family transporter [Lacibacterium aquatile]|uniref:DMT family transporter n=1 Tax=Lacibacterium aquatile TaxID=1168082 RepID=A0ABW5DZN6_9PROT
MANTSTFRIGLLFGLGVPVISALTFAVARLAPSAAVEPITLSALRFLGALPVVLVLWFLGRRGREVKARPRHMLAVGLLGGPIYAFLLYAGFSIGAAGLGGAVLPASLIAVTLLLTREPWPRSRIVGVTFLLAGIGGLMLGRIEGGITGIGLFILTGAVWAVCAVLAKRWQMTPVDLALSTVVVGLLICAPVALWRHPIPGLETVLLQMTVQGGLNAGLAVWLYGQALHYLGSARTALFTAAIPPFSAIAGWGVLGEPLGLAVFASAVMVSAGIVLALRK